MARRTSLEPAVRAGGSAACNGVRRHAAKAQQDVAEEDLLLCRLIDEEYTSRPFYGSLRMVVFLRKHGPRRQSQTRAASDAQPGLCGHGAGAKHE